MMIPKHPFRFPCFFTFILIGGLTLGSCGTLETVPPVSPLVLISMDGFRWDYMDRTETPNMDYLVDHGVKAESMIPVFPSKTFPNHITIVTGLYPENHGIVSNTMYDEVFDAWYRIGQGSESVKESRWYEGEPIWVTAERQGETAATFFWPASEAEISGIRPTYWYAYDGSVPNAQRIQQVIRWLDLPNDERPDFITLYFSDADSWGHRVGPEDPRMDSVIHELDAAIGMLLDTLRARDSLDDMNMIVTSDHGMTATSPDRVIFLDDYINLEDVLVVDWSPVAMIRPNPGMEEAVYARLNEAHPSMAVYRKEEIPERFHYRNHRRITPLVCVADEGWSISYRAYPESHPDPYEGGTHGYDNRLRSMHATFIASGPAFQDGLVVDSFQNIHLYELMCHILNLDPADNDGSLDSVRIMLNAR
ncbi:MAG: ectonucleotide pyrophosphatase/phosphodiesterase [Fidelibacterota bacterium]